MSSPRQHTPGPWNTESADGYSLPLPEFFLKVYAEDPGPDFDFTIAFVRDADATTRKANARLIAAAPDLLAALETIANQCGDFATVKPALDYATIGNIARAAIARATTGGNAS